MVDQGAGLIRGKVLDFTLGRRHACASVSRGGSGQTLYCWGDNSSGQVEQNGTAAPKNTTAIINPVGMTASSSALEIIPAASGIYIYDMAAGENHTCLHLNGGFQCFGHIDQLGLGPANGSLNDLNPIMPLIYR